MLGIGRERIRELAELARLPFADDETNEEMTFARNRIRAQVLPVLRGVNASAEPNIAETRAEILFCADAMAPIVASPEPPASSDHALSDPLMIPLMIVNRADAALCRSVRRGPPGIVDLRIQC